MQSTKHTFWIERFNGRIVLRRTLRTNPSVTRVGKGFPGGSVC
jgi:hypothetical protein